MDVGNIIVFKLIIKNKVMKKRRVNSIGIINYMNMLNNLRVTLKHNTLVILTSVT